MTQGKAPAPERARYLFGEFRLCPEQRRLWRGDQVVAISPRALDLLIALVRAAGQVLEREALLASVWAGLNVSDSNLTVAICTLRHALGDAEHYIATIPGRGYQFTAPVRVEAAEAPAPREPRGGKLRVTVELYRPDDSVAWAGTRQWPAADGFTVHDRVAAWLQAELSAAAEE